MDSHESCMFENTNGEMQAALDAEAEHEKQTGQLQPWFLYFSDPDQPPGWRFKGACIVLAHGLITAIDKSWDLGINPGCAVGGKPAPAHDISFRDRLITSDEEMAKLGWRRR